LGGAHHDPKEQARLIDEALVESLKELDKLSQSEIRKQRSAKYRAIGSFAMSPGTPAG
jgi:Acetyl-CoA carboxylase alpha subunit